MEDREQGTGNREPDGPVGVGGVDVDEDAAQDGGGDGLEEVRDLILKAYPDIVAEMVIGDTVDGLLASVAGARAAFSRIAANVQEQAPAVVPAGSGRRPAVDAEALSPEMKIRVGIGKRD